MLQQEEYEFSDPVTQFLTCLYVDFDFEGAQQKLAECETVLENDFFLTALKVGCDMQYWDLAESVCTCLHGPASSVYLVRLKTASSTLPDIRIM